MSTWSEYRIRQVDIRQLLHVLHKMHKHIPVLCVPWAQINAYTAYRHKLSKVLEVGIRIIKAEIEIVQYQAHM